VDVDLKPDFTQDAKEHAQHQVRHAMMRE
jgi:hypothetical protein